MKSIEIIGEAASKVSPESRHSYPEVPWTDIVGMRNRLIHAYWEVDPHILWETIALDIPTLIPMLQRILATES